MNITDILSEWKKDTVIDDLNLDRESNKIPSLHSKYLGYLSDVRMKMRQFRLERRILVKTLHEYYHGDLNNPDDLKRIGREPFAKRILKNEVMSYVEADSEVVTLDAKIEGQQELLETIMEILKSVNSRQWTIKNAVEWRTLQLGN